MPCYEGEQESNGALAPLKPANAAAAPMGSAARDGQLTTFNDRLHEVRPLWHALPGGRQHWLLSVRYRPSLPCKALPLDSMRCSKRRS